MARAAFGSFFIKFFDLSCEDEKDTYYDPSTGHHLHQLPPIVSCCLVVSGWYVVRCDDVLAYCHAGDPCTMVSVTLGYFGWVSHYNVTRCLWL